MRILLPGETLQTHEVCFHCEWVEDCGWYEVIIQNLSSPWSKELSSAVSIPKHELKFMYE